jgi:hypothetical protein
MDTAMLFRKDVERDEAAKLQQVANPILKGVRSDGEGLFHFNVAFYSAIAEFFWIVCIADVFCSFLNCSAESIQ